MIKIFIPLLFLCTLGYSQNYKSLASEYIFEDLPSSIAEFIERDNIITDKTIIVKSYGSEAIDIQTWRVQSIKPAIYYVELASGRKYEYPSFFTLQYDEEDKVKTITCNIPPSKNRNLPDNAPTKVRFIID